MPSSPVVTDEDFPALEQSANEESVKAQNSFLRWSKIRLAGIVAAAIGGAIGWKTGHVNVGGVIAFLAFATALAAELILAIVRPDRVWYQGRAAAESAKTLSWRYMVHGASFEGEDATADASFLAGLRDLLDDLVDLPVHAASAQQLQISSKMREVRALSFVDRRQLYLAQRIEDQQGWYASKAAWNAKRARVWLVTSVALEFAGLIGGAVKAVDWADVDLLGIFAAAAAAATAWLQAKQHDNLATAYGVTSLELSAVAAEWQAVDDETGWAKFVSSAEEAISREHTLWRASRGVTGQPRRE